MTRFIAILVVSIFAHALGVAQELTPEEMAIVKKAQQDRIVAVEKAMPSVIAIYGNDRQGGGSGVIIDPSGLALTNHHVIMGAGVEGWGGLADGKLYRWTLIGTDPGGDVSLIQMESKTGDPFPFTNLGDSDDVRVGDWAMAMGNPFILTEDQKPTVTLGIVSGVKRYQWGAGQNQLVYGNCIQVDSSINPGNSGGPLFNMQAEVIGINGRGSFQDRGRVNVGLGYAISSNQIKNFIPDLLATKLVEHGTLDASFSDREGKVVCSTINEDAPVARAGLALGDELISFEDIPVTNANQYTNLICTLPEDWPAKLVIRKPDGKQMDLHIRMYGLPYSRPEERPEEPDDEGDPNEEQQARLQREMFDLLAAEPGEIRKKKLNVKYAQQLLDDSPIRVEDERKSIRIVDAIFRGDEEVGSCTTTLSADGRFVVHWKVDTGDVNFVFDGKQFFRTKSEITKLMTLTESKLSLPIIQALGCVVSNFQTPFEVYGKHQLDGSDKALSRNAYRFKLLDDDEDWFYFWMSMYDDEGMPKVELLKAGADIDCKRNDGGVGYEGWETKFGWRLPHSKSFIVGLQEKANLQLKTKSVELVKVNEAFFEVSASEDN
jgi:S1-C subfamily serine protease